MSLASRYPRQRLEILDFTRFWYRKRVWVGWTFFCFFFFVSSQGKIAKRLEIAQSLPRDSWESLQPVKGVIWLEATQRRREMYAGQKQARGRKGGPKGRGWREWEFGTRGRGWGGKWGKKPCWVPWMTTHKMVPSLPSPSPVNGHLPECDRICGGARRRPTKTLPTLNPPRSLSRRRSHVAEGRDMDQPTTLIWSGISSKQKMFWKPNFTFSSDTNTYNSDDNVFTDFKTCFRFSKMVLSHTPIDQLYSYWRCFSHIIWRARTLYDVCSSCSCR